MPPAARITDMHVCPMVTGVVPHVGGPIATGCPTVLIGLVPAARVTDMCVCVGPPDMIAKGSMTVMVGGMPAARIGDMTVHGGTIVMGCPTVMIGDVGSGGSTRTIGTVTRFRWGLPPWETRITYGPFEIRPDPNDPTYQTRALAMLIRLDSTSTMDRAFDDIANSGHTVTIENYHPGPGDDPYNAYCTSHDINDALTPGVGSDSTVTWSPDIHGFGPPGTTPASEQPGADIIAGHEIIHAAHNATGDHGDNWQNDVAVNEERNTVGLPAQTYNYPGDPDGYNGTALPDSTGGPYTENGLREEYRNRGIVSPSTNQTPVNRPSYYTGGGTIPF